MQAYDHHNDKKCEDVIAFYGELCGKEIAAKSPEGLASGQVLYARLFDIFAVPGPLPEAFLEQAGSMLAKSATLIAVNDGRYPVIKDESGENMEPERHVAALIQNYTEALSVNKPAISSLDEKRRNAGNFTWLHRTVDAARQLPKNEKSRHKIADFIYNTPDLFQLDRIDETGPRKTAVEFIRLASYCTANRKFGMAHVENGLHISGGSGERLLTKIDPDGNITASCRYNGHLKSVVDVTEKMKSAAAAKPEKRENFLISDDDFITTYWPDVVALSETVRRNTRKP